MFGFHILQRSDVNVRGTICSAPGAGTAVRMIEVQSVGRSASEATAIEREADVVFIIRISGPCVIDRFLAASGANLAAVGQVKASGGQLDVARTGFVRQTAFVQLQDSSHDPNFLGIARVVPKSGDVAELKRFCQYASVPRTFFR